MKGKPYLAPTRAALSARDGAAALHAALAAWRENRAPAVANLIDAISTKISGPPILDEREWTRVAVVKDPLDLGRLLPAIPHLPGRLLPAAGSTLAAFPDDPRLAVAIGAWIRDPPVTSKTLYAFWTAVLGAAVRIADSRAIVLFEQRLSMPKGASVFWPRFYAALQRALDKLHAVPPPEPVDEVTLARCLRDVERLTVVEPARVVATEAVPETPPLARAAQELAAGRVASSIDHMLVAWRDVRSPAIADAIDRATRLLPAYDRPLATSIGKVHAAWVDVLHRDPSGAMPQLLQHLNVGGPAQSERRLLELAGLPDDPRVAMRLVELASMPDIPASRNQYWRSLYELVGRVRDVRTCEPLRRQLRDFAWIGGHAPHRHAKRYVSDLVLAPPMEPRLDERRTAQLAQLVDALAVAERAHDQTERALLAAIAEDRSDDGPYLVYADWLYEREHPRGALISLACKRYRTNSETARYVHLEDLPYVFGYLYDFARRPALERGLPRRLFTSVHAGTLTWRTAAALPLMSLIESIQLATGDRELGVQRPTPADFAAFLLHPNLERLETVEDVPAVLADPVAAKIADRFEVRASRTVGGVPLSVLTRVGR